MLELVLTFIVGYVIGRLSYNPKRVLSLRQYLSLKPVRVAERHVPYFEPIPPNADELLNCTLIENGRREDLKIPAQRLSQFLSLPQPVRLYWTGDNDAFSKCRRIVNAWGWIRKDGKTYVWASEVKTLGRRVRQCESWGIRLPPPYPGDDNTPVCKKM